MTPNEYARYRSAVAELETAFATAESEAWRAAAVRHDGSWWTDWTAWLAERSGELTPPPPMGTNSHPAMEDAPGTYVLQRF